MKGLSLVVVSGLITGSSAATCGQVKTAYTSNSCCHNNTEKVIDVPCHAQDINEIKDLLKSSNRVSVSERVPLSATPTLVGAGRGSIDPIDRRRHLGCFSLMDSKSKRILDGVVENTIPADAGDALNICARVCFDLGQIFFNLATEKVGDKTNYVDPFACQCSDLVPNAGTKGNVADTKVDGMNNELLDKDPCSSDTSTTGEDIYMAFFDKVAQEKKTCKYQHALDDMLSKPPSGINLFTGTITGNSPIALQPSIGCNTNMYVFATVEQVTSTDKMETTQQTTSEYMRELTSGATNSWSKDVGYSQGASEGGKVISDTGGRDPTIVPTLNRAEGDILNRKVTPYRNPAAFMKKKYTQPQIGVEVKMGSSGSTDIKNVFKKSGLSSSSSQMFTSHSNGVTAQFTYDSTTTSTVLLSMPFYLELTTMMDLLTQYDETKSRTGDDEHEDVRAVAKEISAAARGIFAKFGTHLMDQGVYGGYFKSRTIIDTSSSSSSESKETTFNSCLEKTMSGKFNGISAASATKNCQDLSGLNGTDSSGNAMNSVTHTENKGIEDIASCLGDVGCKISEAKSSRFDDLSIYQELEPKWAPSITAITTLLTVDNLDPQMFSLPYGELNIQNFVDLQVTLAMEFTTVNNIAALKLKEAAELCYLPAHTPQQYPLLPGSNADLVLDDHNMKYRDISLAWPNRQFKYNYQGEPDPNREKLGVNGKAPGKWAPIDLLQENQKGTPFFLSLDIATVEEAVAACQVPLKQDLPVVVGDTQPTLDLLQPWIFDTTSLPVKFKQRNQYEGPQSIEWCNSNGFHWGQPEKWPDNALRKPTPTDTNIKGLGDFCSQFSDHVGYPDSVWERFPNIHQQAIAMYEVDTYREPLCKTLNKVRLSWWNYNDEMGCKVGGCWRYEYDHGVPMKVKGLCEERTWKKFQATENELPFEEWCASEGTLELIAMTGDKEPPKSDEGGVRCVAVSPTMTAAYSSNHVMKLWGYNKSRKKKQQPYINKFGYKDGLALNWLQRTSFQYPRFYGAGGNTKLVVEDEIKKQYETWASSDDPFSNQNRVSNYNGRRVEPSHYGFQRFFTSPKNSHKLADQDQYPFWIKALTQEGIKGPGDTYLKPGFTSANIPDPLLTYRKNTCERVTFCGVQDPCKFDDEVSDYETTFKTYGYSEKYGKCIKNPTIKSTEGQVYQRPTKRILRTVTPIIRTGKDVNSPIIHPDDSDPPLGLQRCEGPCFSDNSCGSPGDGGTLTCSVEATSSDDTKPYGCQGTAEMGVRYCIEIPKVDIDVVEQDGNSEVQRLVGSSGHAAMLDSFHEKGGNLKVNGGQIHFRFRGRIIAKMNTTYDFGYSDFYNISTDVPVPYNNGVNQPAPNLAYNETGFLTREKMYERSFKKMEENGNINPDDIINVKFNNVTYKLDLLPDAVQFMDQTVLSLFKSDSFTLDVGTLTNGAAKSSPGEDRVIKLQRHPHYIPTNGTNENNDYNLPEYFNLPDIMEHSYHSARMEELTKQHKAISKSRLKYKPMTDPIELTETGYN